jgi:hypothetical protein
MAELIAAVGTLASVITVAEQATSGVRSVIHAVQHWKSRNEYWFEIQQKYSIYLVVSLKTFQFPTNDRPLTGCGHGNRLFTVQYTPDTNDASTPKTLKQKSPTPFG